MCMYVLQVSVPRRERVLSHRVTSEIFLRKINISTTHAAYAPPDAQRAPRSVQSHRACGRAGRPCRA